MSERRARRETAAARHIDLLLLGSVAACGDDSSDSGGGGGTTPIGGPLVGWIGEHWGARGAFLIAAVATSAAAGWLYVVMWRSARGPRVLTRPAPVTALLGVPPEG